MKMRFNVEDADCISATFNKNDIHGKGKEASVLFNVSELRRCLDAAENCIMAADDELMSGLSDCCGAKIVMHDICSSCKEHCDTCNVTQEEIDAEVGADEYRRESEL